MSCAHSEHPKGILKQRLTFHGYGKHGAREAPANACAQCAPKVTAASVEHPDAGKLFMVAVLKNFLIDEACI